MALFTDTRELDRQAHTANLTPLASGWNKVGMNLMGYKSDGSLNLYGKTVMGGGNAVTGAMAAKMGGDTRGADAIKESQGEAWKHTINKGKLALDIITFGGGGAALGSLGQGANAAAGGAANAGATQAGSQIAEEAGKKAAMDALEDGAKKSMEGGVDSFGDKVLTSNPAEDGLNQEGIAKFQEYMKNSPEGTREEFDKEQKEGGGYEKLMKSTEAIPLIGSAINAVGSGIAYHEALKNNLDTDGKKTMNTFNYL
jgi:hypothetical protein